MALQVKSNYCKKFAALFFTIGLFVFSGVALFSIQSTDLNSLFFIIKTIIPRAICVAGMGFLLGLLCDLKTSGKNKSIQKLKY